ncbi:MAG: replication-associated recombination protein A [Deltaproteobacteria bacterium]|nr:replication-associated recombination protein A [Deltaproteobacteria bacterium]
MTDLFDSAAQRSGRGTPLADLARPATLEEVMGQRHLLGPGNLLIESIRKDTLFSMILWGPPGTGKTTIAHVIAKSTGSIFVPFSAVLGGVKEVRAIVAEAAEQKSHFGRRTILFVDEIHRFNKAQQDAFLPHVERGTIVLIGATTENPSFALISPLLSRCRVLVLELLSEEDLAEIVRRGIEVVDERFGLRLSIPDGIIEAMARASAGDARRALSALELIATTLSGRPLDRSAEGEARIEVREEDASKILGEKALRYDRSGEEHYNVISAFIKSLRGSDPDAAVYYMARMLEAGEDPLFILRRMMIFAAEDVGLADPQALVQAANATFVFEHVGLPEGYLPMTQAALYLATAPKSNTALSSYQRALAAVKEHGALPVPMHLRNPVTPLMKEQGYGDGYRYPHDRPGHWVPEEYLPEPIRQSAFYEPTEIGYEKTVRARLEKMASLRSRSEEEE